MVRKLFLLSRLFMALSLGLHFFSREVISRAVPIKFDLHLNLSCNAEIGSFRHPLFRAPRYESYPEKYLLNLSNSPLYEFTCKYFSDENSVQDDNLAGTFKKSFNRILPRSPAHSQLELTLNGISWKRSFSIE